LIKGSLERRRHKWDRRLARQSPTLQAQQRLYSHRSNVDIPTPADMSASDVVITRPKPKLQHIRLVIDTFSDVPNLNLFWHMRCSYSSNGTAGGYTSVYDESETISCQI